MFKTGIFLLMALVFAACGSKNDDKTAASGEYYGTYEFHGSCSTEMRAFSGDTAEELSTKFCDGLKDNSLNKGCALVQRQAAFKAVGCRGVWPYDDVSGVYGNSYKAYNFSVDSCGTGLHAFGASTESEMLKMYCKALKDEVLNRGCARGDRDSAYFQAHCDRVLSIN